MTNCNVDINADNGLILVVMTTDQHPPNPCNPDGSAPSSSGFYLQTVHGIDKEGHLIGQVGSVIS